MTERRGVTREAGPRHSGRFIVLEGVDGCGSTTQARLLGERLRERGLEVVVTAEPSAGPIGRLLRELLARRLVVETEPYACDWATMALLFAADRLDHVEHVIRPALERGAVVISDRYYLSTLVYQSATAADGSRAIGWLRSLNSEAPRPDLTLVLAVEPEISSARRRERAGSPELYEDDALQARLTDLYCDARRLCPLERIAFVAGDATIPEVTSRILAAVEPILP